MSVIKLLIRLNNHNAFLIEGLRRTRDSRAMGDYLGTGRD
jgi:hypothetical protein